MAEERASTCPDEIYLEPEVMKDLTDRLHRIEGHVRGIARMLEEHKSCDDLLGQLAAVRSAVNQVAVRLLEGHMATCVADSVERGEGVEALARLKGALASVLRSQ